MSNRKYRTASLDGLAKLAMGKASFVYDDANYLHVKWLKAGLVRLKRIPRLHRGQNHINITILEITQNGWQSLLRRAKSKDTRFRLHRNTPTYYTSRHFNSRNVDLHAINLYMENLEGRVYPWHREHLIGM